MKSLTTNKKSNGNLKNPFFKDSLNNPKNLKRNLSLYGKISL